MSGEKKTKSSAAQKRASMKWTAEHADRITLQGPRGFKARIKAAADAEGVSMNQFIRAAVESRISAQDPGPAPETQAAESAAADPEK